LVKPELRSSAVGTRRGIGLSPTNPRAFVVDEEEGPILALVQARNGDGSPEAEAELITVVLGSTQTGLLEEVVLCVEVGVAVVLPNVAEEAVLP
jgi:hypothetical protein